MIFRRILITGGAGFVGSSLALALAEHYSGIRICAFDNLMRPGSSHNLADLKARGVDFLHGDVRCQDDWERVGSFDLLIDCAAEPSVHAGTRDAPRRVIDINLLGTVHSLEAARRRGAAVIFLSSSRVYSIAALRRLNYAEKESRFELSARQEVPGASARGIDETFPVAGARSLYGTTKLASELFIEEYAHLYGLRAVINRCSLLTGPRQMGRTDQGVVAQWVGSHLYGRELCYIGFGGAGKQVRDVLHVRDLFRLIQGQAEHTGAWSAKVYNVGGGSPRSVSIQELTRICRAVTGQRVPVRSRPASDAVDIPIFVTDYSRAATEFGWQPRCNIEEIVNDVARWISTNKQALAPVFAG